MDFSFQWRRQINKHAPTHTHFLTVLFPSSPTCLPVPSPHLKEVFSTSALVWGLFNHESCVITGPNSIIHIAAVMFLEHRVNDCSPLFIDLMILYHLLYDFIHILAPTKVSNPIYCLKTCLTSPFSCHCSFQLNNFSYFIEKIETITQKCFHLLIAIPSPYFHKTICLLFLIFF